MLIGGTIVEKNAEELMKRALEQPGVFLIMAAYKEAEEVLSVAQQYMAPYPEYACTTSDRSD